MPRMARRERAGGGMDWPRTWARASLTRRATPETPPDADLIAAARTDPDAFLALYERYVDRIYGYCFARLGDCAAAEDATSEVFTKAFAAIGRYQDGIFAAWLFRIAHNVVVDARRRRVAAPLAALDERPDPARGPDELAQAIAEGAAVRAALSTLAADERAVVELPYAGWSGEEIAAHLGRSPAAVKQLRYRAMRRLRALLISAGHAPEEDRDA